MHKSARILEGCESYWRPGRLNPALPLCYLRVEPPRRAALIAVYKSKDELLTPIHVDDREKDWSDWVAKHLQTDYQRESFGRIRLSRQSY